MILLLLLLGAAAVAGSLHLVLRDERGPGTPPASHPVDLRAVPPARLLDRR